MLAGLSLECLGLHPMPKKPWESFWPRSPLCLPEMVPHCPPRPWQWLLCPWCFDLRPQSLSHGPSPPTSVLVRRSVQFLHKAARACRPGCTVLICPGHCDKGPQAGWLTQQNWTFSQFWRLEVELQKLAGLVPPGASFLGLLMAVFLLCPQAVFPLYLSVLISSYRDACHIRLGSTHVTSF